MWKHRGFLIVFVLVVNLQKTGANTIPTCTTTTENINLLETTATATTVVTLTPSCSDVDTGADGTLSFTITSGNGDAMFSLSTAGVLTLDIALDYDGLTRSYGLIILVSDGGTPPLSLSITVNVFVLSANDNDPEFFGGPYTVTVDESAARGDLVAQANPVDFDLLESYDFQSTYCSILAGVDSSKFSIDITTGTITLFEPLDFETAIQHVIEIEIYDLGILPAKTATSTVTIDVNNVNDNTPVCTQSLFAVTMTETTATGTTLQNPGCTDVEDANLVYRIATGDTTKFEVANNGDVKTLTTIDVDTEATSWTLVITCRDRDAVLKKTATVTVIVFVTGIDDNIPVWAAPDAGTYIVAVDENVNAGTLVTTIAATDADQAGTADSTITYSIDTVTTMFGIDSSTGQVSVIGALDRETTETYSLTISAYSSTLTASKITGTLTITVNDLNDNSPVFTQAIFTPATSIAENTATNTVMLTVAATDTDKLTNGQVTYSISSGNTATGCVMAIDSTSGQITNTASLDYESATSCTLIILATDGGATALVSTATAVIAISPVNEATPDFGADFTASFAESVTIGTSVTAAVATDTDAGNDGVIQYSLNTFGTIFNIDASNGDIYLAANVDRETTPSYIVVVHGIDQSGTTKKTGSVSITITIDDANDNTPSCASTVLLKELTSAAVNDIVHSLTCTDADTGVNAALTYTIASGNTNTDFAVSTAGVVTVANLPSQTDYQLQILVSDTGATPLSTTVYLTIKVYVVSTFTALPTTESVIESTAIGTLVHTVLVTVASGLKSFQIMSGNADGKFSINAVSGKLFLYGALDRETTASYSLVIRVTDTVSTLTADATLTITVTDFNDITPSFANSFYTLSIVENVVAGTTVQNLPATDTDFGVNAALTYAIFSGNADGKFAIGTSGELTTAGTLDAETTLAYTLVITATDNGAAKLTGTTTVYASVTNVDEFPVTFGVAGNAYTDTLAEDTATGTTFFTVTAQDQDVNTVISYAITAGNTAGIFVIDSTTGELILSNFLDRETAASHSLTITADNGAGTTLDATLDITVSDVNDNDPDFSPSFVYTFNVDENQAAGITVGMVTSTDVDSGVNANIVLSIIGGNTGTAFQLVGSDIKLIAALDFETTPSYILLIQALDQGTPARSSTATVNIAVNPIYAQPQTAVTTDAVTVAENTALNTLIYDMDATVLGAIEGTTGDLKYVIQSGNAEGKFSVSLYTGELTVVGALDRETTASYIIVIRAENRNDATKRDTVSLTITLTDINDNDPVFGLASYTWTIDEGLVVGSTPGTVIATDADSGTNAAISFAIVAGESNSDFTIDSTTGVVTTTVILNAATRASYLLTVVAVDSGTTPRTASSTIVITVNDINDQVPTFSQTTYNFDISEGVSVTETVFSFYAADSDTGANGRVNYNIVSGNAALKFTLGSTDGQLVMANTLDRESLSSYVLVVEATDSGATPNTGTTTFSVTVLDVNDNTPVFATNPYTAIVLRTAATSTTVTTVAATDADAGTNSDLRYSIVSGNTNNLFHVDSTSGIVTTLGLLTAAADSHALVIQAEDRGVAYRSATTTLSVTVDPIISPAVSDLTFTVSESIATNSLVGTVTTNPVHAGGATVDFTIVSGNQAGHFQIGGTDGQITNVNSLDYETTTDFYLLVNLKDRTDATLDYDKNIHVIVTDANDLTPVFNPTSYTTPLVENSPVGVTVLQVTASDGDSGTNAQMTFELSSVLPLANTYLQIDNNGVITVKQEVDYETITAIVFEVLVKDGGTPINTATAAVTVNIIDVLDTATVTGSASHFFSLECATEASNADVIRTLTGTDFGLTVGATDTLAFLTLSTGGVFSVGSSSGDFAVQDQTYLFSDSRYFMDIIARMTTAANVVTASSGLMRVDAFVASSSVVVLTHSVDVATVSAQTNALRTALQTLFPATTRLEIWKHQGSSSTARRRLLATGSESLVYVVSDTSADTLDGLESAKSFQTQAEILAVLQQADGSPVTALSSATYATFPVTAVSSYTSSSSTTTNWAQSTVGIAVLSTIGCSIVLLAAILAAYFFCTRSRKYRFNEDAKAQEQSFTNAQPVNKDDRHPLVPQYSERDSVFGKQPITGKTVEVESRPPQAHMLNGVSSGYHPSKPTKKSKQDVSVSMMNGKSYDNVTSEHCAPTSSPALSDLVLTSLDDLDQDIVLTKPRMHTPVTTIPSCDTSSPIQPWSVSSSVSLNSNHHDNIDSSSLSYHGDHDVSRYDNQNGGNHIIYHGDKIRIDEYLCTKDHGVGSKTGGQSIDRNGTAILQLEHELKPRARSASTHWDVLLQKAGFGLQSLRKSAQIRRPLPMPIFKDSKIGSKMECEKDTDSNLDIVVPRPGCYGTDTLHPMFKGRTVGFVKPMYRAPVSVQYGATVTMGTNGMKSPKPGQDALVNTKNAWARVVGWRPTKQTTQPAKQPGREKMASVDSVGDH